MSNICLRFLSINFCSLQILVSLLIVLLLTSVASGHTSREVETLLKVDRDVSTQDRLMFEEYDNYRDFGYNSLTSIFVDRNCSSDSDCRPWFYCDNGCCKCGRDHHGVMLCNNDDYTSAVLSCHCVSYINNSTYVGACIYRCANEHRGNLFDPVYSDIVNPHNDHDNAGDWMNNYTCGLLNRTGKFCGQCLDNHSVVAYSYELKCIECPEADIFKNWIKYIFAGYSFLTIFYFIVFFFKVNVTSSSLHGFVFFSQIVAMPTNIRFILLAVEQNKRYLLPAKILLAVYGISNLDFFRMLYPEFCLNISTLGMIALDYAIAIYPLVLVMISFILMKLHIHNFKPIVFICKPFQKLFTHFRRNWNMQTSVVDAYATLFLLSFSKVLNVTFDLLIPSKAYELGTGHTHMVVYNDANLNFLSHKHMVPYGILAISFLIFFILLPVTILLLYPCRCCRSCLKSTKLHSKCLQTFVDAFFCCYKDGTETNSKDYRYFASFYLIVRILLFIVFTITLGTIFFAFAAAIFLLFTLLVITVQPHKNKYSHYTKIDATFMLLLVIMCTIFLGINIATVKGHRHIQACFILAVIFAIVPLIYFAGILFYTVHIQKKWDTKFIMHFRAWRRGYKAIDDPDDDDSLPDRLLHPTSYAECSVQASRRGMQGTQSAVVGTAY